MLRVARAPQREPSAVSASLGIGVPPCLAMLPWRAG